MRRPRYSRITAALAFLLIGGSASSVAFGQDDALDRLLEKLDRPADAPADNDATPDEPKSGEVAPEDRDLDSLLEKLGETPEEAAPRGKPQPPAEPPAPGEGDAPTPPDATTLEGQEKSLDEHLEELLGRKKKKPEGDNAPQPGGGDGGPLTEAIKKMEEARKRLADSDTGQDTRKTQGEIVKELDQILQRLRQQQGNGQGSQLAKRSQQAGQGNKPGGQPGDQPSNTGAGVGASTPKKATVGELLSGRKDTWGDLPPHLREEMENVFKEDMLPAKRELIMRYYSSVARKGRASGESRR